MSQNNENPNDITLNMRWEYPCNANRNISKFVVKINADYVEIKTTSNDIYDFTKNLNPATEYYINIYDDENHSLYDYNFTTEEGGIHL